MNIRLKYIRRGVLFTLCTLAAAAALWWVFVPKPPLWAGVSLSTPVLDRNGDLLRLCLTSDQKYRLRTPLSRIAPELVEATLLYEDRYFYSHPGVNPLALLRAAQSTYLGGGRRMGASTITMQLARLRWNLETTTISGKLRQMERALALERHYSKEEILEAYFTLAPYGGNVEGVEAAARVYFQTNAGSLSLTECLSLVGVPQNPSRRNPLRAKDTGDMAAVRSRLSGIWLETHPEDADNAFFHNLPLAVHSPAELPFLAPHVASEGILAQERDAGRPVETTIDPRRQALVERLTRDFVKRGRERGIRNACVVLLHWPSMEIHALAGSADFHDPSIMGQVDGTKAPRSPGSTVKPFIYALALDQGLIHPRTLLYDAPRSFKGYDPENADGRFRGPLPAAEALILSRNIPALALANRLSKPDLYDFLQMGHAELPKSKLTYGLSLVLGGAEISPRRLAALYAVLPNQGVWKTPVLFRGWSRDASTTLSPTARKTDAFRKASDSVKAAGAVSTTGGRASTAIEINATAVAFTPATGIAPADDTATPAAEGSSLLSAEAAALTLDMLRDNPAGQRMQYIGRNTPKLPAYWKTGTSNGYRDAWAAGVFGPYVLVVWVGNFDGSPNPAFTGAGAASGLFLDIEEAVAAGESKRDLPLAHMNSLNLTRIPVCADTGDVDTRLCPETATTWFIPGVSPIADSGIYREILVDTRTGLRACADEGEYVKRQVWAFWPSELHHMFREAGMGKKPPPPFGPECAAETPPTGAAPRILSPKERVAYHVSASQPDRTRIALQASADADTTTLFWFYGTTFIGRAAPDVPLYWTPPGGKGILRVLDDAGRSATREVAVELLP